MRMNKGYRWGVLRHTSSIIFGVFHYIGSRFCTIRWQPFCFKGWLSFGCNEHGCQIGNPGNDDDEGVKDEDRPDQQHHWKSLLYDQVATIMVANLAILADVIRVVRTKLRRDQTHVSRLFVL